MTLNKIILTASILAFGSVLALPAQAKTAKTYDVHYTQSELASPQGAARVLARIQGTAFELCADEFGTKRFLKKLKMQRCLRSVTKDLATKVGHKNMDKAYANLAEKPRHWARSASSMRLASK